MTIRLRCAECRRKLKVVDEALGKKVQCPVCGARFIGRIESSPPPGETPAPKERVEAKPATPSLPNLELDDVPAEYGETEIEPLEPEILEEESEPVLDVAEAADETDAIEVVDEVEEDESAEEEKPKPKQKKSRAILFIGLAVGFVLLLGLGGGYAVYRYINGTLFESNPKPFTPPVQPRPGFPPGPAPQPTPGQRP